MEKSELNYRDAINELEGISNAIEHEDLELDQLVNLVERAGELIHFCKNKLGKIEVNLNDAISKITEEDKKD